MGRAMGKGKKASETKTRYVEEKRLEKKGAENRQSEITEKKTEKKVLPLCRPNKLKVNCNGE